MKINAFILSSILLVGCVSSSLTSTSESGIVFNAGGGSFILTKECVDDISVNEDAAGRVFISTTMKDSESCSETAYSNVFSKVGKSLSVKYNEEVLVQASSIVNEIDPSTPLQIPVNSHTLANKILSSLQSEQ